METDICKIPLVVPSPFDAEMRVRHPLVRVALLAHTQLQTPL